MAAKRSYGKGSLYTRTDAAGQAMWYGRWWSGSSQFKRRIGPVRATGSRGKDTLTELQAEKALAAMIAATPQKRPPIAESAAIGEVGERYARFLEHQKGRKRSTLTAVRSALRVRIAPFFGDKHLDSYKKKDVEQFVEMLQGDELTGKTIRNYLGVLSAVFKYAIAKGLARENPCVGVELPAKSSYSSDDIHFLEPVEVEALAKAAMSGPYEQIDRALYMTAAMTGLRQGELLALRWRDVDWTAGRVRVRQNYVLGEFGTPKSKRSTRSVPMADAVGGALDGLHKASGAQAEHDLVFADPHTNGPLRRGALMRRYRRALKAAHLDETLRFHDLRHTFGTRMAAQGVPMRALQEMMGHRDIKTTEIYVDYAPSEREVAQVNAAFEVEPLDGRGHIRGPILSESKGT